METLQAVFPYVPVEALVRVLDVCDQNVEAASDWLLGNDWQELIDDEEAAEDGAGEDEDDEHDNGEEEERATVHNVGSGQSLQTAASASARSLGVASPASSHGEQPGLTMAFSAEPVLPATNGSRHGVHANHFHRSQHRDHHRHGGNDADHEYDSAADPDLDSEDGDEEEEEEDDEDDDDDEDGDANSFYDSGDESYYAQTLPQLAKRVKITRSASKTSDSEFYWASFDGQVVPKTLIELLNTTLTKLAHSSVTLLSKSSNTVDETEAQQRLKSILKQAEDYGQQRASSRSRSGSSLSRILNASPPESPLEDAVHSGLKRKRTEEGESSGPKGFFAYFFPVSDLDMVWRSILHPHIFNGRFGEVVEFHTASTGVFARRDFDELMHIHTNVASSSRSAALGVSPLASMKCCLLLPCEARDEEIFRIGKHLHTLLKLPGSLYYRAIDVECSDQADGNIAADLLNEDGKLSEESFRRYARYRIKKEEVDANDKADKDGVGVDHFLAYQQPRKVDYCLQLLEKDSWVQRVSG